MLAGGGAALGRRLIPSTVHDDLAARYVVLGKRLTRLIQYLREADRRQRG
jgi:hypothetical protein